MKICPNCGAENEANALICVLCEYEFDIEENGLSADDTSSNEYVSNEIPGLDMKMVFMELIFRQSVM